MSETLKHVTLLAWLVNRSFLIWELGVSNLGVGISDLGVRIWLGYFEMVGFLVGGGGCLVQVWW